jgi:hypothetical protein
LASMKFSPPRVFDENLENMKKRKQPEKTSSPKPPTVLAPTTNKVPDIPVVDLKKLHGILLTTKGQRLEDVKEQLYAVLNINARTNTSNHDYKLIKNNVNYKIKNLLITYPFLAYYGKPKDFTIARLYEFPEILVTEKDAELKKRFQGAKIQRRDGSALKKKL